MDAVEGRQGLGSADRKGAGQAASAENAAIPDRRPVRTFGAENDRGLDALLRGAAGLFEVPVAGLAWAPAGLIGAENDRGEGDWDAALRRRIGQRRGVLVFADAPAQAPELAALTEPALAFLAAFPLRDAGGVLLGAFYIGDTAPRGDPGSAIIGDLIDYAFALRDLLEARRDQVALEVAQSQLANAERLAGLGHCTLDRHGRLLSASPAVYAAFGLSADKAQGRAEDLWARIHPDDVMAGQAAMERLHHLPDEVSHLRQRTIRPDGACRTLSVVLSNTRPHPGRRPTITGMCQDVTDTLLAHEALSARETHFRHLTETASDLIMAFGPDGILSYVSPSVKRILGYEAAELVGRDLSVLFPVEDQAEVAASFAQFWGEREPSASPGFERRMVRRDGAIIWIESRPTARRDPVSGEVLEVHDTCRDITDRRAAALARATREHQLRLLAAGSSDLISQIDRHGRIGYLSPAAKAILGVEPASLVGRSIWDFIHPEDRASVEAAFAQVAQSTPDEPTRIAYRIRQSSGEYRILESNPVAIRHPATGRLTGYFDLARDVTERIQAEITVRAALQASETARLAAVDSEARYRLLAEAQRDITVQFDRSGVIRYISPSCARLGYAPEELLGTPAIDLTHPDDRAAAAAALSRRLSPAPDEVVELVEFRVRRKDGAYVCMEGAPVSVRDADGQVVHVNTTYRDVSERRALEQSLLAARQAAEVNEAKSEFLANMSHELRTPLTSVIGFSQLIQAEADLPDSVRRAADRIAAGGKTLLATINSVLDLAKVEAGDVRLAAIPSDPAGPLRDAYELLSERAREKGVALSLTGLEGLPAFVSFDADRFRQVLLNLVGNALKFTGQGRVEIAVAYDAPAAMLGVRVIDTGEGVAEEHLDRLFLRFSQVDGTMSRRHGGTGLGLAISRGIVIAMGGEIGADSVLGQGSCFWFRIPAPACTGPTDLGGDAGGRPPPGSRVLVVDDNVRELDLAKAILQACDAKVAMAADGASAIAAAAERVFDVILMDRHMPGMDGIETTRQIRRGAGANRHTPILLWTADGGVGDGELAALFDGEIPKPVSAADLLAGIAAVIDDI